MEERGWKPDEINIEYLGYNSLLGANADPAQRDNLNECFLRMTMRTQGQAASRKVSAGCFPGSACPARPMRAACAARSARVNCSGCGRRWCGATLIEPRVAIDVEAVA